jgi:hypothetical protein
MYMQSIIAWSITIEAAGLPRWYSTAYIARPHKLLSRYSPRLVASVAKPRSSAFKGVNSFNSRNWQDPRNKWN